MQSEPDRTILARALADAFGQPEASAIMRDHAAYSPKQPDPGPVWMGLEGCWMFRRWGMVIGVERDGYVHS